MRRTPESRTWYEILGYLAENPDAQDTFEGIVQWWLLEQRIDSQTAEVRRALTKLVSERWVIESKAADSRIHYRINPNRRADIQAMLRINRPGAS